MINPYDNKSSELLEHETMVQNLSLVLNTDFGRGFIKYLLKHFGFGDLPAINSPENLRDEYIGFLRAGQSLFEIVSQADAIKAGLILAEIYKEKKDESEQSSGQ